jgi:hypothetical protein
MVIGPCILFPLPPLKFRTAGFPQYGFKPDVCRDLRCWRTCADSLYAATRPLTGFRH